MNDIKTVLHRYRLEIQQFRQWLAELPEVAHVLDTLSATAEGTHCLNAGTPFGMEFCDVQGLREQLRKMRAEKEAAVLAASAVDAKRLDFVMKHGLPMQAPSTHWADGMYRYHGVDIWQRTQIEAIDAAMQASQSPQDQVKEK